MLGALIVCSVASREFKSMGRAQRLQFLVPTQNDVYKDLPLGADRTTSSSADTAEPWSNPNLHVLLARSRTSPPLLPRWPCAVVVSPDCGSHLKCRGSHTIRLLESGAAPDRGGEPRTNDR